MLKKVFFPIVLLCVIVMFGCAAYEGEKPSELPVALPACVYYDGNIYSHQGEAIYSLPENAEIIGETNNVGSDMKSDLDSTVDGYVYINPNDSSSLIFRWKNWDESIDGKEPYLILNGGAITITQEELCGEYICEEPGFGGMFTLTLQEDGMFSYYEGSLSSYIGYGSWDYSENKLTLKDTGYGEEWDIFFTVIDGCLVYDKESSHTFIYVDLNDGTRFVPKEQINDEWLANLDERILEQEQERAARVQEMHETINESREEALSHINRRPFLGAGFLGSVCFDAIENQADASAPIRIWVEDGLGNVLWEFTMGLDEEDQNSFYFYEAPGTIDYIIEYNASTKYHFDMFTLDSNGTKINEVVYDVPETTDLETFNTEVKPYFEYADIIIGTVGGSVSIKLEQR